MGTFPGCEASVRHQSQTAMICSDQHCDSFTESQTFHEQCAEFGKGNTLYPVSTAQCFNPVTKATSEPTWQADYKYYSCGAGFALQMCYCCCSCLGFGTPVAIPGGGAKAIELFSVGDEVSVGDWKTAEISWNTGVVKFSRGTDPGSKNTMMFIEYADKKQLIATPDNLFLLSNGKLKRADRLVPGQDQIMGADNQPMEVTAIHAGEWFKGLHHIAASTNFNGSLDGHLINANGVVCGDYCLQINQHELVKMGLMEDPSLSPAHGSNEFAQSSPHLSVSHGSAMKPGADIDAPDGFQAFIESESPYIPENAAALFTKAQAEDIVKNTNASFRALHDDSGFESMSYLIKVFKSFYPEINITIDKTNQEFNTWAFEIYGQKQLVISGEILRMNGLYQAGYKFFLAQGIARLIDLKPYNSDGLTYVAAADFYAVSKVLREVFYLTAQDFFNDISQQIGTLFGYISKANGAGDPNDLANDPPVGCRIGSLQTGLFGGHVLPCSCDDLQLTGVFSDNAEATNEYVQLAFNKEINPESIVDLYNFKFSAADNAATLPKVLSAEVSPSNAKEVILQVTAPVNQEFTITVEDISSIGGSILNDKDSGTFTFKSK